RHSKPAADRGPRRLPAARVAIAKSELDRLPPNVRLVPGMPVEAFVKTENRTVLSYLIHPFMEQLNRAMRED
ncbi:MAG: aprE, partial [Ferruginibacter sp.]|nr:aprE [Ferruginibacter sp.]